MGATRGRPRPRVDPHGSRSSTRFGFLVCPIRLIPRVVKAAFDVLLDRFTLTEPAYQDFWNSRRMGNFMLSSRSAQT